MEVSMSDRRRVEHHRSVLVILDWVVFAAIGVVSVANFIRIDSTSHSASDTLINWIPQTAILVVIGCGIAWTLRRLAERPGR
jgi:hypothetical protein